MENNTTGDQLCDEKLARKRENNRKWYLANKEHVSAYAKKYRGDHKDHLAARKKAWRNDNKEHCLELCRNYHQKNKDSIKEKANAPNNCDVCGGRYTHINKCRHLRTHKHALALKHKLEQEQTTTDLTTTES